MSHAPHAFQPQPFRSPQPGGPQSPPQQAQGGGFDPRRAMQPGQMMSPQGQMPHSQMNQGQLNQGQPNYPHQGHPAHNPAHPVHTHAAQGGNPYTAHPQAYAQPYSHMPAAPGPMGQPFQTPPLQGPLSSTAPLSKKEAKRLKKAQKQAEKMAGKTAGKAGKPIKTPSRILPFILGAVVGGLGTTYASNMLNPRAPLDGPAWTLPSASESDPLPGTDGYEGDLASENADFGAAEADPAQP